MKIGIDIDDVIADFIPTLALYYNRIYDAELTKEDFTSYDFWNVWGGDIHRAVEIVDAMFADPTFCEAIPPISDSFDSLDSLKESGAELFAITGRRDNAIRPTELWIEDHFPNVFTSLHFTNSYCQKGKSVNKSVICSKLGVEIIVEDNLKHALDCAGNGVDVLLYDTPWNRSYTHTDNTVQRVHSWNEVMQHLG
ncbi:hypothetical protein KC926_01330 [Candidatus Kaiserbacteria bacterium]|nr:hypothetical protein [Candidatus Kaiserbacteria bacterium]